MARGKDMNLWTYTRTDTSPVTRFACEEFVRLMKKADPDAGVCEAENGELKIGLFDIIQTVSVKDASLDDAIAIDVENMKGYITGSNERSVLFAVYRFFVEAGARFIRPGKDGEVVPRVNSGNLKIKVGEAAANRYRGICFEGSAGYEHFIDIIDFAPKLGMNIIFTQLWRPTFAFNRWYKNEKSPSYVPSDFSEQAQDMAVTEYDAEIIRRGLDHHKMGHGWIPSVLGEKSGLWHGISKDGLLREEDRELVAMINGERSLFNGSAVDTSFCYGNPKARSLIVDEVVKYAEDNPNTDTIHFWLADQPNNQCECDLCRDTLPSDFYVDMLNELDEKLIEKGIDVKIVFLAYLELFWTPKRARIKNPDRFSLLFAPIRRPYEKPLSAQLEGEPFPFERNKWKNPASNFSALHYLNEWKKQFPGECILFDYHLMWDMYNDITGVETGKLLATDMAELEKNGMCGMISCQSVRVGFVGALPMYLMSKALWNGKTDLDSDIKEYYEAAFGDDTGKCRIGLDAIRAALDPNILRGVTAINTDHLEKCEAAKKALRELDDTVSKHLRDEYFPRRVSYLYLAEQLRLCDLLLDFLSAALRRDEDSAKTCWSKVLTTIGEIEALYPRALDAFEFSLVWHRHVIPLFFPKWNINYDTGELTM